MPYYKASPAPSRQPVGSGARVIQVLAYAVFLIPAAPAGVFLPLFQPYTFGKTVLFEITVELMLAVWAVSLCGSAFSRSALLGKTVTALAVFFAAATISTALSPHPAEGFWGSSARMDGLFTLLHFAAFFFVLTAVVKEKTQWQRLIKWSVGASVFTALYGIAQWFGVPFVVDPQGEIFSTLGNPASFAMYLLFHVFFALYLARRAASKESATLFRAIAALEALVVLLTGVSAAFLALGIGLAVAAYPFLKARSFTARGVVFAGTGLVVVLALFLSSPPLQKLNPFAESQALAAQGRLAVWRIAATGVFERPVFGHGPNQFERIFLKYKAQGWPVPATGETFDKPHNAFLEVAVSFGIFGLAAYAWLLWRVALQMRAMQNPRERFLFFGLLAAYLISLFFLFDTFSSLLLFFFLLAFLQAAHKKPSPPSKETKSHIRTTLFPVLTGIAGAAACAILVLFVWFFHFKPLSSAYFAHRFFTEARATGTPSESLKEKALRFHSFNRPFIERAIFLFEQKERR